jgi:putative ABC transport system permease protein
VGASAEKQRALETTIQDRLRKIPGVEGVGATWWVPLTATDVGSVGSFAPWGTEQQALADPSRLPQLADPQLTLPGYLETIQARLIEGRTFRKEDTVPGREVTVVDESLAAKAFPNQSAVGKHIVASLKRRVKLEIIGVVAHQRMVSVAEPGREEFFVTDASLGLGAGAWVIRTTGDPMVLAPFVREALKEIDPLLSLSNVRPMDAIMDRARTPTRFATLLIAIFAAVAAVLAAIGLYGVLATLVRQRTAEIGIRMALGAQPARVFARVVGAGLQLSAIGIAIGLAASFGATRAMASLLVGVKPTDPFIFSVMTVVFLLIAAVACWLPARRAATVDPVVALKEE